MRGDGRPSVAWLNLGPILCRRGEQISLYWQVHNSDEIAVILPTGDEFTYPIESAPHGITFSADVSGPVELWARRGEDESRAHPVLVQVVPKLDVSLLVPAVPRVRLFLPLAVVEDNRIAGRVSNFSPGRAPATSRLLAGAGAAFDAVIDSLLRPRRRSTPRIDVLVDGLGRSKSRISRVDLRGGST